MMTIAAMLRPGGILLSDREEDGDLVLWYQKAAGIQ